VEKQLVVQVGPKVREIQPGELGVVEELLGVLLEVGQLAAAA
jgi:hypothetical protein